MVFRWLMLLVALGAAFSCSGGKYPLPPVETPSSGEPAVDPPVEPVEPSIEVTMAEAFNEGFDSDAVTSALVFDAPEKGLRYFPGFPSLTENGKTILMMRLGLDDAVGTGPAVTTKDCVHFGSFSVRMKLPDTKTVQPKLGARVEFGPEGLELGIDLSSPTVGSYNAASKFYIYGMDWSGEKVTRWIKTSASGSRKVLEEITENLPQEPRKLVLKYYHDKDQAPYYPYELEVDWIDYSPAEQ